MGIEKGIGIEQLRIKCFEIIKTLIKNKFEYHEITLFFENAIDEVRKQEPAPKFDKPYLDRIIKKASKNLKGIDVDKWLETIRG